MSQPLDQLVYGWSEHGLEGSNRLQLVATTPSWAQDNKYRRVAQRLARLEAAGDRYPLSFGWADIGGRRFVFQRTLVPSPTGDARRLVAHVVAGPPEDLPVDLLLRCYDSRFWWRGQRIEPQLDGARPDDLADGWTDEQEPEPTVTSDALLQRVLAAPQGMPATFEGDWRDTYACLWGIHRRVPGLLEALSCSTYETGQMVTWFDVAGLDGRPRPHGAPWCARNASEPRYSPAQAGDLTSLVASAKPTGHAMGSAARKAFRETLRVGERIVSGHAASVPSMLTFPQTLPTLLQSPAGIRGVADALWARDRQQWPAADLRDGGPTDPLIALAVAAADEAHPEVDASMTAVARRLQSINRELGPVFVERILARLAEGAALPRPDHGFLAAALGWAYDVVLAEEVMTALLLWAQRHLSGALLDDRRLPEPWRAWLFEQAATTRGALRAPEYAHLMAGHPELFEGEGWLPQDEHLVEGMLGSDSAELRAATARAYCATRDPRTVARTAAALHQDGRVLGCAALLDGLGRTEGPLDAATANDLWALLAKLAGASVTGRLEIGLLDLPWQLVRRLGDDGSWVAAAGRQLGAARADVGVRMQAWKDDLRRLQGADRASLMRVVLHDAALHTRTVGGFAGWTEGLPLDALEREPTALVILTALQRRDGTARQLTPPFAVALEAAVTRTGFLGLRVTAGGFEEPLRQQVRRIRADSPNALADARATLGRPAVRWLRKNGAW